MYTINLLSFVTLLVWNIKIYSPLNYSTVVVAEKPFRKQSSSLLRLKLRTK